MKGASSLVIFSENLTAIRYGKILETALIDSIHQIQVSIPAQVSTGQ